MIERLLTLLHEEKPVLFLGGGKRSPDTGSSRQKVEGAELIDQRR